MVTTAAKSNIIHGFTPGEDDCRRLRPPKKVVREAEAVRPGVLGLEGGYPSILSLELLDATFLRCIIVLWDA